MRALFIPVLLFFVGCSNLVFAESLGAQQLDSGSSETPAATRGNKSVVSENSNTETRAALKQRGIEQYRSGNFLKALSIFVDAFDPLAPDIEINLYISKAMYALGNIEEAVEALNMAIEQIELSAKSSSTEIEAASLSELEENIYLELANIYTINCELAKARAVISQSLQQTAGSVALFDYLVQITPPKERLSLLKSQCSDQRFQSSKICADGFSLEDSVNHRCSK